MPDPKVGCVVNSPAPQKKKKALTYKQDITKRGPEGLIFLPQDYNLSHCPGLPEGSARADTEGGSGVGCRGLAGVPGSWTHPD